MPAASSSAETTAIPLNALIHHLPPAAQRAYHHERRRGRDVIEALTYGVILPEIVETIMARRDHA